MIPLGSNPPDHAIYRRPLNRYFTPARVTQLEPKVRVMASEHIDRMLASGGGDGIRELAAPLPAQTLCELLNMPPKAWHGLADHLERMYACGDHVEQLSHLLETLFVDQVQQLIASRRREPLDPDADLISGMLALQVEGEPLANDVLLAIGVMVMAAGHDTTTSAISEAIHLLATSPTNQQRLRAHPSLIPMAVEEVLRLWPPLHQLARTASKGVEVEGRQIPAGGLVALSWAPRIGILWNSLTPTHACLIALPTDTSASAMGSTNASAPR